MTKRIAFLVDSMAGGGAERVTLNLANEYCKQGYDVDLVLAHKQGPYLQNVDKDIRIVDLNVSRFWTYILPMVRYFRHEKPDVMLSATTILNLIAILTKLVSFSKTHLVISEHINIISFAKNGGLQRAKIVQVLMRWLYPRANNIVAVSGGAADGISEFSDIPRDKITTIYNGVIDQHKLDLAQQPLNHPWFDEKRQLPVIVAVGRLQRQKNYEMLLGAFAELLQQSKANLLILGEGELREDLEKLAKKLGIEEYLSLHGFDENPFKYLANADLFVLSSLYEGLPTVLIEALACGCPVVSTNCPSGPEEILNNGEFGRLTPVGNQHLFAKAMIQTLQEQNIDKQRLMDHGRHFNIDNAVVEYAKVLGINRQELSR